MKFKSNYTSVILKAKNGTFTGYIKELPGAISQGDTVDETKENLKEALQLILNYQYNNKR